MATFPESRTRKPQFGYDNTPDEKVKRTPPEAGNSYQRDAWGATRFTARMDFLVSRADAGILWTFYETNRLIGWTMYDFETQYPMRQFSIGPGDGVTSTFTIPAKETASQVVKVNGATKTAGVHYNISAGTGALGEDQVIFTGGNIPPAAATITVDANGRRRYTVEFTEKPTRRSVSHDRILISMRVQERFPLAA